MQQIILLGGPSPISNDGMRIFAGQAATYLSVRSAVQLQLLHDRACANLPTCLAGRLSAAAERSTSDADWGYISIGCRPADPHRRYAESNHPAGGGREVQRRQQPAAPHSGQDYRLVRRCRMLLQSLGASAGPGPQQHLPGGGGAHSVRQCPFVSHNAHQLFPNPLTHPSPSRSSKKAVSDYTKLDDQLYDLQTRTGYCDHGASCARHSACSYHYHYDLNSMALISYQRPMLR